MSSKQVPDRRPSANGRVPQTPREAFDARVVRSPECWQWTGWKNRGGYGCVRLNQFNRKAMLAHRLSWVLHYGEIPPGKHVLHRCDNRECTRPDHLFLGTNVDNIADRVAKGRPGSRAWLNAGERHPRARLSDADCAQIRAERKAGARCVDLAKRYGVTQRHISAVSRNLVRRSSC